MLSGIVRDLIRRSMMCETRIYRVRNPCSFTTNAMTDGDDKFCLADYDAVGFDLDHTLAKYRLVELMNLAYDSICESLIKQGYDPKIKDKLSVHKDFVCKGLFLDSEKGNILKLGHDGKILKCSHGTRMMEKAELLSVYGEDLHWEHFQEAIGHVKRHGKDLKFCFFENYFDIPALVCCAHIVDFLDKENGGPCEKYDFWKDIYGAFGENYIPAQFTKNAGWFFPSVKKNPEKYLKPSSNGVREWLKDLKGDKRVVFLMTSSAIDFAGMVIEIVLGSDWRDYFDIYLTDASKPGFFTDNKKFKLTENGEDKGSVDELEPFKTYSNGNMPDLMKFLSKQTGKSDPKVVYFGDSLCADSFPAKTFGNWDVVLVLEEMEAEGYHPDLKDILEPKRKVPKHQVNLEKDPEEERYILSQSWGSFFYHEEEDTKHDKHMNTYWGRIISHYNTIAVPTIEYIAGMPIDYRYTKFKNSDVGNTDGFYPGKPKPLLT
ncbi:5'-nucleotidase domain-containing protein 1-like [Saccostrea echinata]|uniref:5'-nucleotidase domain-containing protein 1-like n=1 Tax=Saccostrea echinata TaxID=191078 RepID=UPI002A81BEB7|nr:5'-nucleotidase domain-containing protein 1-like [Saccostrea echinata]